MDLLQSVMSYKCFNFLVCQMHFDDSSTRDEWHATNNLAAIEDIFDRVVAAFRQMIFVTQMNISTMVKHVSQE